MNNKVILIVVLLLVVGSTALMLTRGAQDKNTTTDQATTTQDSADQAIAPTTAESSFVCKEGQRIRVAFANGQATVTLKDGTAYTLERQSSTSGDLYASEGRQVVFWLKGDTATVEENGKQTHSDCIREASGGVSKVVRGKVTSIDRDQVAADGPFVIVVASQDGAQTVTVPSFGINLCAARDNIQGLNDLKVGDTIEVRGSIGGEGVVTPCESPEDFLRVVQN